MAYGAIYWTSLFAVACGLKPLRKEGVYSAVCVVRLVGLCTTRFVGVARAFRRCENPDVIRCGGTIQIVGLFCGSACHFFRRPAMFHSESSAVWRLLTVALLIVATAGMANAAMKSENFQGQRAL